MTPTGAVWLFVAAALTAPDVSGPVARTLDPTAVVRHVAAAAALSRPAPPWAEAGIVGLQTDEVQAAVGVPQSVVRFRGGLEAWTYRVRTGDLPPKSLLIVVSNGRVARVRYEGMLGR